MRATACHVFHIDWLQTRATATDQRQHRQQPGKIGERAEQCVARLEWHSGGRWWRPETPVELPVRRAPGNECKLTATEDRRQYRI
jgi:hypothetical protein